MRYKSTIIKKDSNGNRVLRTTEYPKVERQETDVVYYTRDEDSYMSLANRFYEDQSLWWVIARANSPFKGKFKFESGTKLIIPMDLSTFFAEHDIINSKQDSLEPK